MIFRVAAFFGGIPSTVPEIDVFTRSYDNAGNAMPISYPDGEWPAFFTPPLGKASGLGRKNP